MKSFLKPLAAAGLGLGLFIASPGFAQDAPPASAAGATPIQGDGVYKAFHEREGIERVVGGLLDRVTVDPRTADKFKGGNLVRLKLMLVEQICYLTGGPCEYHGKDMRSAHEGMGVSQDNFNALAEDLQKAMDAEHVPFTAQNALLAKLAPMERKVVTR